jgi:uncharacterized membrane protein YqjE
MNKVQQEILIYLAVALSALFFMGYAVHMMIGGLVSPTTEYVIVAVVCVLAVVAMGFMAWDVVRRRRAGSGGEDAPG